VAFFLALGGGITAAAPVSLVWLYRAVETGGKKAESRSATSEPRSRSTPAGGWTALALRIPQSSLRPYRTRDVSAKAAAALTAPAPASQHVPDVARLSLRRTHSLTHVRIKEDLWVQSLPTPELARCVSR